ncbi:MAG: hypothetical protein Kow0019_11790 [Methanobacteriaceae archaeon]
MNKSELEKLTIRELLELSENDISDFRYNRYTIYEALGKKYQNEGKNEKYEEMKKEYKIFLYLINYSKFDPNEVQNAFSDEDIEYYKKRAKITNNPIQKAIYCDIVWEYNPANYKYGLCSIDTHLSCAPIYFNNNWDLELASSLKRAMEISIRLRRNNKILDSANKHMEFIEKLDRLKRFQAPIIHIIKSLLESENKLRGLGYQIDYHALKQVVSNALIHLNNIIDSFHMQRKYLELLSKLENDVNRINCIKIAISESYVQEGEWKRVNYPNGVVIAPYFHQDAINSYKQLPNSPETLKNFKFGRLEKLLIEFRGLNKEAIKEMNLRTFSCEEIFGDYFKKIMENNFKRYERKEPDEIFKMMSVDRNLYPSRSSAEKLAKSFAEHSPRYKMFSTLLMHGDVHTIRISNDEEKKFANLVKYIFVTYIKPCVSFWLNKIFEELEEEYCNNDKIISHLLVSEEINHDKIEIIEEDDDDYLEELMKYLSHSELISDDRLEIIKHGIQSFRKEEFVASINILVFQIEGIIRDICENAGLPTLSYKDNDEIRALMPIEMLNNLKQIGFFEDFIEFIKIFLYDNEGNNYRNIVAHGLAEEEFFTRGNAQFLLLILIKFAEYRRLT